MPPLPQHSWGSRSVCHTSLRLCKPTAPAPRRGRHVGNDQLCPVPADCYSQVLQLPRASPSSGCLEPVEIVTSAQPHVHGLSFCCCRLPPLQSGAPAFSVPQCRSSTGQCWAVSSQEGTGALCVGCRSGPRGVCCNPSPALLCLLPLPAFLQAPWGSACYSIQSPALSWGFFLQL